jgi:hypothetical protein
LLIIDHSNAIISEDKVSQVPIAVTESQEDAVRLIDFTVGRPCDESECDDDLIIVEQDNLEALSRGTDMTTNEAWADAVAAMGPARARMFSSDADVEPVPGLGLGLGID